MSMMMTDNDSNSTAAQPYTSKIAETIMRLHRRGSSSHLTQLLSKIKTSELANILDSFPEHKASEIFTLISPPSHAAQVLELVHVSHRKYILSCCTMDQALAVLKGMSAESRHLRMSELDVDVAKRLTDAMQQTLQQDENDQLLQYERNTAGSIMNTSFFSMPQSITAAAAIQAVQGLSSHESVFYLYVVDEDQHLVGVCSLRKLILADPDKTLKEFTHSRLIKVHVDTPQGIVANQISRYRLLAMPVVDDLGVLVGQITVDDLIDVIQEEHTSSLMKMVGIGSKNTDVLAQSPFRIFRDRVPWLISAFVAYLMISAILDGFEETLSAVVQLAFFFPIVIGMSGNAGSQTGTVIVRGLALGTIHNSHFFKLLFKELGANLIQGLVYGSCLALAAYAIFRSPQLSMAVGPTLTFNIIAASAIAMSLPFFFKRLGADPAVAAGPLALAFIDMVGSINYLVIASLVFNL
ncbi:MAG: magnesium transporter [Magnetococcales bacterium]|nr:magnesium transporter [Magnetococcales bacterium]